MSPAGPRQRQTAAVRFEIKSFPSLSELVFCNYMFKGLGNLGNIASMMAAFKDLPQKMQELNARMQTEHVRGDSSCGRVYVIVNCVGQVQLVKIVEQGLSDGEIEQAVVEATNAAGAAAKQTYAEAIREMVANMNLDIPGIDGILTSLIGR